MVFHPSDGMHLTVQDIVRKSSAAFAYHMEKLGKTLEEFDVVKEQTDSAERRAVMQAIKDRTEDMMYFIHTLDGLTNNLPDRNTLTNMQLHDAFEVILEVRRLIDKRASALQTTPGEIIQ